jgi:hypothetical protein
LVDLYKKSLKDITKAIGSYEYHLNDESKEATISETTPLESEMPSLTVDNYMNMENMKIEYNLNDVFEALTWIICLHRLLIPKVYVIIILF